MLKVKVNCPICGALILARSLESHLERVHELVGLVTLRLHPTRSYDHEPEEEPSEPTEPTGAAPETEPQEEKQQETEGEPELAEPEA